MSSFDSVHHRGYDQYNGHHQQQLGDNMNQNSRPHTPANPVFMSSTPVSSASYQSYPYQNPPGQAAYNSAIGQQQHQQPQAGPNIFVPGSVGDTLQNPIVADMAMQYGQSMVGRGRDELTRNLSRYGFQWQQLRYYFSVDTTYVGRKLTRILCPFIFGDWSLQFDVNSSAPAGGLGVGDNQLGSEPAAIQPKLDVNACDLYIPTMAYVTYILVVGLALGLSQQFSPDRLASAASASVVALLLEIGLAVTAVYFTLVETSVEPDLKKTTLSKWDVLSLSMYKYVSAIVLLILALLFPTSRVVYVFGLIYFGSALAYFILRTMKPRLHDFKQAQQNAYGYPPQMDTGLISSATTPGRRRRLYLVLMYTAFQPVIVWWLTFGLASAKWISNSGIEQGYYYNNE